MSDELIPPKKPLWRRVLGRLIKISLILAVLLFILLTVLSRIGGNSDVLKSGVEDYITDATPYTARIGSLNNMQFFPSIHIDVSNVDMRKGDDGTGESAITIETAKITFGFFDVMFRPGRVQDIQFNNLHARADTILAKPIILESFGIQGREEGDPHVAVKGTVGKKTLNGRMGLDTVNATTFKLGNEREFDLSIGQLKLTGILKNPLVGGLKLENLHIAQNGKDALRGNFDLDTKKGEIGIKGQARLEPNKSQIDPRLTVEWSENPTQITGNVDSGLLVYEDVSGNAPFLKALDEIGEIFGDEKASDRLIPDDLNMEIDADIDQLRINGVNMGSVKTPITMAEGVLNIGDLDGKIRGGKLSGNIKFSPEGGITKYENNVIIKGFDYGEFQREFVKDAKINGTGDIRLALSSKGKNIDALVDGLSGKVEFVSGNAEMETGLLEIWGGGLLNALLPNIGQKEEMKVNCVVVNMDVKNLKGQSDAVFVDTGRITVHGKGTFDFQNQVLDMVVEPKAKSVAIGDLSSAVNVSGPINDLQVSPNLFSLGKKVGGLLLGAVNPAFYALSLANLGLGDNHPCKKFVIEKEVLPPPTPKTEQERENPDPATNQSEEAVPAEGALESLGNTSVGNE